MPASFVLINVEMGFEEEVLKALKKDGNVKDAYVVDGLYDIIAKVEAKTMEKLKESITWSRRLDKVRSALTMIVAEGPK